MSSRTRSRSAPASPAPKPRGKNVVRDTTPFITDTIPKRRQISLEVSGEPDYGKTHICRTFPNPLFLDTEGKAWIVLQKFDPIPWKYVKTFHDVRKGIEWGVDNPDIDTIIIDSGADLRDMAQDEWLQDTGKERVFPIVQWAEIYNKIDEITEMVIDSGKHFVTTARLKDEYIQDQATGRRIRDGYKKYPWSLNMSIRIQYGIRDVSGKPIFPDVKFARVVKNNYHGIDPTTMNTYQKPFLFDVSYDGIVKELLEPWHKDEGGVALDNVRATIVAEARDWLESRGYEVES